MSDTPQAQTATAVQDQQVTQPAPTGNGPWAQDLAAIFQDESTRGQVDQFLREKVQPYTTRLEQQTAQAQQAVNLWNQFEQSPIDTYVQVTHELYGEEAAKAVLESLQGALSQQEQQPAPTPQYAQQSPQQAQADPRLDQLYQWYEQDQATKLYDNEMSRVKNDPNNADIADKLDFIHPFVAAAEGDFDRAVQAFREYAVQFGVPQQAAEQQQQAPPVFGSDTGTAQSSAAPVQPRKQSLDEAINDFMAENRAAREAPPVA